MKYKPINRTFKITNKITLYTLSYEDRYTLYLDFCDIDLLYYKSDYSTPTFVYKNLFIDAYFFNFTSCSIYIYIIDPNSIKYV